MNGLRRFILAIFTLYFPYDLLAIETRSLVERFSLIGVITSTSADDNVAVLKDKHISKTLTLKQGDGIPGIDDSKVTFISRSQVILNVKNDNFSFRHSGSKGEEDEVASESTSEEQKENAWLNAMLNSSVIDSREKSDHDDEYPTEDINLDFRKITIENTQPLDRHEKGDTSQAKDKIKGEIIDWQTKALDCEDTIDCEQDLPVNQRQLNSGEVLPELEEGLRPDNHHTDLDQEINGYQDNAHEKTRSFEAESSEFNEEF